VIKASLILVVVYCASRLLRRRSAAELHMLWLAAIVSAALLPLLSLLLPSWQSEVAGRVAAALPGMSETNPSQPATSSTDIAILGIEGDTAMSVALLVVWGTGSAVALFFLFAGSARLSWIASRSSTVTEAAWTRILCDVARGVGVKRKIRLVQSGDSSMPVTWGVAQPRVLLPLCASEWSEDRRRVVLAHELAHVRRLDWLSQILSELACAAYWFNPLFWIARNRMQLESERACDDTVLNLGVDGQDYASHLLEIARSLKRSSNWSPALAMARQFSLETRLVAVLNPTVRRQAMTRKTVAAVALMTLCVAIPLAALRAASAPADTDISALPQVMEYTSPPLYSDEAHGLGIEGIVRLEVRVKADGRAGNLRVLNGLGFGLDENALLAVRDWRFRPGRRNGRPVESTTQVDVEFNLRNAELNELIANDMATRVGPGVVPPRIIHRVEPEYPVQEMTTPPAGAVILDAVIQENGIPKVVRVVRSITWKLDESAINALEQWKFSPALKDGQPVKVRMNVAMTFEPKS
jgi:TonB family protein